MTNRQQKRRAERVANKTTSVSTYGEAFEAGFKAGAKAMRNECIARNNELSFIGKKREDEMIKHIFDNHKRIVNPDNISAELLSQLRLKGLI